MSSRAITPALAVFVLMFSASVCRGQLQEQSPNDPPALEETPVTSPTPSQPQSQTQSKEKLARVWSNEPPLVRLARDKFGAELTDSDAKFFAAVAANEWADLRASSDTTFDSQEPSAWSASPVLKADRLKWLCTDPAATKLVPSHGIWLRGASISGKIDLYRCDVPFSITFYDCLFADGLNIAHAKLQELDIRNCCSAAVEARALQTTENVYLLTTCVYGGLDFIDANIGGDFDFSGGLAFHGTKTEDLAKQGIALNFHDAKVAGDINLGDKFRALGQVRLIGTQIGRSLTCGDGKFKGGGLAAIDARRSTIGSNAVFTTGFSSEGGVEMRRSRIGGDFDCDGGRFIAGDSEALSADLVNVGGQLRIGDGFHAEGEVRLINAVVEGDVDCDNGHFLNPDGDALSLDGARRQYAPLRAANKKSAVSKRVAGVEAPRAPRQLPPVLANPSNDRYAFAPTQPPGNSTNPSPIIPTQFEAPAPQMTPPAPMTTSPAPDAPSVPVPITPPPEAIDAKEGSSLSATIQLDETTTGSVVAAADDDLGADMKPPGAPAPQSQIAASGDTKATTTESPAASTTAPDPTGRRYITQPYTQLASVYRAIGQDEQANTVLVARAERLGELAPSFSAQGLWYGYLGRLIGYGYEPFRAIKIGVAIIAIGALIFAIGARRNLMAETKLAEQVLSSDGQSGLVSPTYPRFNALVYSLDVFLPFVDLNQVCYWIPGEKPMKPRKSRNCLMHIGPYSLKWSAVLHGYLWFQTLAGWTLCTLLAAAVTGIVES